MRPEHGCIIQIYISLELKARNIHEHYLDGVNDILYSRMPLNLSARVSWFLYIKQRFLHNITVSMDLILPSSCISVRPFSESNLDLKINTENLAKNSCDLIVKY